MCRIAICEMWFTRLRPHKLLLRQGPNDNRFCVHLPFLWIKLKNLSGEIKSLANILMHLLDFYSKWFVQVVYLQSQPELAPSILFLSCASICLYYFKLVPRATFYIQEFLFHQLEKNRTSTQCFLFEKNLFINNSR